MTCSYCGDSTCGANLLSQGWYVLAEFGTVDSFGQGLIDSHDAFLAKGWRGVTSEEGSLEGATPPPAPIHTSYLWGEIGMEYMPQTEMERR